MMVTDLEILKQSVERTAARVRGQTMRPEPATYEEALADVVRQMQEIVIRRHHRYGMNLLRHGEYGIIVRIDDKTERIKNMLGQGDDDAEEPREMTWFDVMGYAAQAILIGREQFALPMRMDQEKKPQ
jgi:hypothetical protein